MIKYIKRLIGFSNIEKIDINLDDYYPMVRYYLSNYDVFAYPYNENPEHRGRCNLIRYDKNGYSAEYCFAGFLSQGVILPTTQPIKLIALHNIKRNIDNKIDVYSNLISRRSISIIEFKKLSRIHKYPDKFIDDVINNCK